MSKRNYRFNPQTNLLTVLLLLITMTGFGVFAECRSSDRDAQQFLQSTSTQATPGQTNHR